MSESGVGRWAETSPTTFEKSKLSSASYLRASCCIALVVGETCHVQKFEAAIARREQRALEQQRADAVTLPWLLDRERRLGLARHGCSNRPQFRSAAQRAIDEKAVNK